MAIEQGNLYRHDFGPRQNHPQEGRRPVVVIQTDTLNRLDGYPNVIVIPVTSRHRPSATYAAIQPSPESGLERDSWAITNQIFTIDKGDLGAQIGKVSAKELFAIKQGLKASLALV